MKSPFFHSAGFRRTPVLVTSACVVLLSACHKPRFQSDPTVESTQEQEEHDAACGSNCNDASQASNSSNGEAVISVTGDGLGAADAAPGDGSTHSSADDANVSRDGGWATTDDRTVTPSTQTSDSAPSSATQPSDSTTSSDSATNVSNATTVQTSDSVQSSDASSTAGTHSSPGDASPQTSSSGPGTTSWPDASLDAGTEDASLDGSVDAGSESGATQPPLICETTTLLQGVVRDFDEEHPDMEPCEDDGVDCSSERGLVAALLSGDGKPVFLSDERDDDSTIQSEETFDQWFRDVEDVNVALPFDLQLTTRPRQYVFDSDNPPDGSPQGFTTDPEGFFPIDEWNTTERPHNYHFTYEITSYIEFQAGDTLTIRGDDDIFVFIDRQLVIDLGGIHLPQEAIVEFDDIADELGLEQDTVYEFHLFFAERHVEQSNLRLATTGRFLSCALEQ